MPITINTGVTAARNSQIFDIEPENLPIVGDKAMRPIKYKDPDTGKTYEATETMYTEQDNAEKNGMFL